MNRKYAWVLTVATAAILAGCFLYALLTTPGLLRQPLVAFLALGIVAATAAPLLWLQYRRAVKYPLVVDIAGTAALSTNIHLDEPPIVVAASRLKVFVWCAAIAAGGAILCGLALEQRGICRVVGVATIGPLFAWNLLLWLVLLAVPPRLVLDETGLSVEYPWTTRRWAWNQVGPISVAKLNIPIPILRWLAPGRARVSMSVRFKLLAPPGAKAGAAWGGMRSIWPMSGEALGEVIGSGGRKWATVAPSSWQPVRASLSYYGRSLVSMLLVIGFLALVFLHPCG